MKTTKAPSARLDLFEAEPSRAPAAPLSPAEPETAQGAGSAVAGAEVTVCAGESVAGLAVGEVRSFPAALFGQLGPTTLRLEGTSREGLVVTFVATSSREAYTAAREAGVCVFVMRELAALAHAAQNHRMHRHVLARILERKRKAPEWTVSHEAAFGGMGFHNAEPLSCTIGDAFDAMGVRLVSVEVHG